MKILTFSKNTPPPPPSGPTFVSEPLFLADKGLHINVDFFGRLLVPPLSSSILGTSPFLINYIKTHRFDAATARAAKDLRNGGISGLQNDTLADLIGRVWPYHAAVARAHDLDLVMYEGGSHVVGLGAQVNDESLTAFFDHLNYAPQMGALYTDLMAGWLAVGGQLFTHYSDVYAPTKWGSWGALRYLADENPRWDALNAWK